MVPKESKGVVKGEYGKTPAPINDEIRNKILGDEQPITCRPADLIEPELDKIKNTIQEYIEQDEDILSYAMLPQVAEKFFKQRIEDRQKASADSGKSAGDINPEVVAAISAAINEIGKQEGKQYSIGNISRINNQSENRWKLYGMLERFRTNI